MPVLYVVPLFILIAALAVLAGIGWLPAAITLALFLLVIIALYRTVVPVVHLVVMLAVIAALLVFAGLSWIAVAVGLALFLLIVIAVGKLRP